MRTNNKIQAVICKKIGDEYLFLMLKYCKEKGGFYQNLTGGVETTDASSMDACLREMKEELKLTDKYILDIIPKIYGFEFKDRYGTKMHEISYGVIVEGSFKPILSSEHESFEWMNFQDSLKILRYDTNKEALRRMSLLLVYAGKFSSKFVDDKR